MCIEVCVPNVLKYILRKYPAGGSNVVCDKLSVPTQVVGSYTFLY